MKYTVYILKSLSNNRYYIGQTSNFEKRLASHNSGLTRSTKSGVPWKLIHLEEFDTRSEAMIRERKIKSYKSGNEFKKLINYGEVA